MSGHRRRTVLFAALYFSEGAPIGFLWWALPAHWRAAGVAVPEITGLLALLALPWAFKFLLAPAIDLLRSPRWPLRAWIASCQVAMGAALLATLAFDWQTDVGAIGILLVLHAVCAAAQDVAVDTYALAAVPPERRAAVNGWMQVGMLTGRSIFGGGALLVGAWLGWQAVVLLLVAAIWSTLILLFTIGEPDPRPAAVARPDAPADAAVSAPAMFARTLFAALGRRDTWLVLGFAVIGGAGYEAVGLLVGPFLVDRGFSQTMIGSFLFLPTVAAMMFGALAAGWWSDRVSRPRAAATALVLMAVTIVALAIVQDGAGRPVMLALLLLLYVLIGAFTTTSYALFMDATDPRLGATQLSAFMSATNLCEAWAAAAGGRLVGAAGYGTAFAAMAGLSLLALPALAALRGRFTTRAAATPGPSDATAPGS